MMRATLLATVLCCSSAAFGADAARDCAAIADPAARLACYDEKHGKAAPAPAPATGAPAAAPAAPAAPASPQAEFGLDPPEPVEVITSITARLVGKVTGWKKGTLFKLDNGQVWRCIDDDKRSYTGMPENAEVTISQSTFGAYWMDISAVRARVKVKRVS